MIRIFNNSQDLSIAAAELFVQEANKAMEEKGSFTVALTGGTSPVQLYNILASTPYRGQIAWDKVFIFWGDERWVDLENEKSNAKMAFKSLITHIPIPNGQVFPMWAEGNEPETYASHYEQLLQLHLGIMGSFDLILLGMGEDGHTASLFPGTQVLQEQSKWVVAYYLKSQDIYRITLTFPIINRARKIVVLSYGEKKANALYEVLEGSRNPIRFPAQLIKPLKGKVLWLVDEAAAGKLHRTD